MKRIYIVTLIIIALIVGSGLLFIPDPDHTEELSPQKILLDINDDSRFWSTDLIADKIIKQDPSLLLIDVRGEAQYEYFSLQGALNIPLENILDPEWKDYFEAEDYDIVIYSNSDVYADQAWIILKRLNYKNIRVMKGGLNHWAETIMQPPAPKESDPQEAFELYNFRRAACKYFGGGSGEISSDDPAEVIQVSRKKKTSAAEGGC